MRKHILWVTTLALYGCTEKTVTFKPSEELDPLPALKAEAQAAPAADPLRDQQWSFERVGAKELKQAGNANLVIAVLSTGVDYTHEDLAERVLINHREITQRGPESPLWTNRTDDDGNGLVDDIVGYDVIGNDGFAFDRHGTGTALAGVLLARRDNGRGISGLLSDGRIYPIRYIGDDGQTTVFHLIRALEIAEKVQPHVIVLHLGQLNLGGRFNDEAITEVELRAVRERLAKLQALRIPVVVGAGNSNTQFGARPFEALLQSFQNVAVVTSSDAEDGLQFLANYSNQYVVTAAPGSDVLSTLPGNHYDKVSSTAIAAAHVAAALAVVISEKGQVPYQDLLAGLAHKDKSDPAPGLRLATLGQNRLNIARYAAAFR